MPRTKSEARFSEVQGELHFFLFFRPGLRKVFLAGERLIIALGQ